MDNAPRRNLGAAMGFIGLVGNLGGVIGPIIVGIAVQGSGNVASGFYIIGFIVLVGGLITYIVRAFNPSTLNKRTFEMKRTLVQR
jgi:nitrate/nitrite transporter NarK